jgi:hypothetical protein
MLLIVLSGIAGAAIGLFALWAYGPIWAVLGAPVVGSITAGLAALWLARRATARSSRRPPGAKEREAFKTLNSNSPE